jgi:16S rRNA (cytosine1402-N4)-methyltransferase
MDETASGHIPVLAKTLTEQINLPQEAVMVDTTIGHGGHSYLFGKTLGPGATLLGLDIDKKSIHRAQSILKGLACRVILIHSNFSRIADCLHNEGIDAVDFILADLGVCSAQLADVEMGLSFQSNMPLDMRFDKRLKTTAADIVNKADEKSLADLIYKFSQERASRRIARFIVRHRCSERITTTSQLAQVVCRALARPTHRQRLRIHPATRTFQALRIAVNNELENLEAMLTSAPQLLKKNGYIAVISYHSLEDRIVKNNFKQNEKERIYNVITKKPIVPPPEEIAENQRARSAKLRIAQKKIVSTS